MDWLRAVTMASVTMWGLGVLAAPAAADGPYRQPPYEGPAPGFFDFMWTGFYIGAHVGAGHTEAESAESVLIVPSPTPIFDTETFGQNGASVVGGVQAGWQKQWDKFVAGIEVTYTALQFDRASLSPIIPDVTRSAAVHDLFTLTGRLGYADGRWLAYAKGGWASAEVDVVYTTGAGAVTASSGGRENGWTAGVGIDYALTYNLFLGIEYNYLHFRADVSPPTLPGTTINDVDVDIQTLVLRLNYRFGGPCCGEVR